MFRIGECWLSLASMPPKRWITRISSIGRSEMYGMGRSNWWFVEDRQTRRIWRSLDEQRSCGYSTIRPYLFGYYDERTLTLSHKANHTVKFTVEVDPSGDNAWVTYSTFAVKANEKITFNFPETFRPLDSLRVRWKYHSHCMAGL